jgi:AcrR family transcriptional regulator
MNGFNQAESAGMLMSMQALPGRASRATVAAPPASVTRDSAHRDQRRRLLRAIGEVVAERGYSDVTVEQIAKRAHVSFNTFYKHYRSKQECFEDLLEAALADAERKVGEALAAPGLSWPEEVVAALRTLVETIVAEPAMARAVIVEAPTVGDRMTSRYERATEDFAELLRAGRAESRRGAELPETIEVTLAGAVFWSAYERLVVGEAETLTDYLPVLTEMILRAYLGPAEASRIARTSSPQREPALA